MSQRPAARLIVAVSSRALFDLEESNRIFEEEGEEAYARYQIANEEVCLAPGVAYGLVRKLLALNAEADEVGNGKTTQRIEVVLASRNSADTGLRIFRSIEAHGLKIERAAFTRGRAPWRYLHDFGAQLFLSAHAEDVREALAAGVAAATILPDSASTPRHPELRIAFDGDAVIFSDEAERIYQQAGLGEFNRNEVARRAEPLPGGPFQPFLAALHEIQMEYSAAASPIRTALVTARGAPAHERVIRTLRSWGVRIDEALFLGGKDKGAFLESFGADIFFDDQWRHCDSARGFVGTGHVPTGVKNPPPLLERPASTATAS
ncbi:MAG: 5'-nucleotidase [Sterolibacterium sp.]|nr:5'-nucleotidase [Sterolibacterium sp.]